MNIAFTEVKDKQGIKLLADTAREIWFEYFPSVITMGQIEYMVEKYQSEAAISDQILCGGYRYFIMWADNETAGYCGVKDEGSRLFLSKLYIKKGFRGQGYFNSMLSFIGGIANEKSMYLTVNKNNADSIAIYKRKGFAISDAVVTDIGNGYVMDDYIMQKD